MQQLRTVRGMRDIIYPESAIWRSAIEKLQNLFESHGYQQILVPIIEKSELFSRSIGEDTDVVLKEMYTFNDRKGRSLSLRPEGTAGVVRAMIQSGLLNKNIRHKVYYFGPMFRYERPQEGRYRQFYQFGCEVYGSSSPAQDAEIAELAVKAAELCGIAEYTLYVNSVGCSKCRTNYRELIKSHVSTKKSELCSDCLRRLESNTLRILDCKKAGCQSVYKDLPSINENYCSPECNKAFEDYKINLNLRDISFEVDSNLVRGLDYYSGPVFELKAKIGTVVAGGRYDTLVSELGGGQVPACGWALGIERLVLESSQNYRSIPQIYIATLLESAVSIGRKIADYLRTAGLSVEEDYENVAAGKKLKMANKKNAEWVFILGDEEINNNTISLKHLETGEQINFGFDELEDIVMRIKNVKT